MTQSAISARYGPPIALIISRCHHDNAPIFSEIFALDPLHRLPKYGLLGESMNAAGIAQYGSATCRPRMDGSPNSLYGQSTMNDDRLELDEVFPAPPSRDEELCRIANLPLEPSFDDTGLELLELDLDPDSDAC